MSYKVDASHTMNATGLLPEQVRVNQAKEVKAPIPGSPPRCKYCGVLVRDVSKERHEQACLASMAALQAESIPGGYFTVASRAAPPMG